MMGLVYPELSLDLKGITTCSSNSFVPKTIHNFLKNTIIDHHHLDVDDFVKRLKDEMNKIQVFKRELPLSMLLLKHALEALQQEIQRTSDSKIKSKSKTINAYEPVLEHFIPLKTELTPQNMMQTTIPQNSQLKQEEEEEEEEEMKKVSRSTNSSDKKNWMSSVQLWTPHQPNKHKTQLNPPKLFVPILHPPTLHEFKTVVAVHKDPTTVSALSLLGNANEMIKHPNSNQDPIRNSNPQSCSSRKQRRCWSPELHRRFVDALTQLGGPQVATPKQIRELMRVDGLTNDEVKSHLQKYRLHIRRVPNNSAAGIIEKAVESSKPMSEDEDEDEDEDEEKSESYK